MHEPTSLAREAGDADRADPTAGVDGAEAARRGDAAALARALRASRRDTLATFATYRQALPQLQVPLRADLNPPLWELGHIGWFQEYWIGRNAAEARRAGASSDPDTTRRPPRRQQADALYNSSLVPHDSRWHLPLPDAQATLDDLAAQLEQTLALLADDAPGTFYFHRLALLHEDMHHEAALYMAQGLGIPIADRRWQARPLPASPAPLTFDAAPWRLGVDEGEALSGGFAFDNEIGRTVVETAGFTIDAQACRWAEFIPFVEDGGYVERRLWSDAGWAWCQSQGVQAPRYLRRGPGGTAAAPAWQQWRHGAWRALDPSEAAGHLTLHEAEAWCRWAGRRLPGEAEWERAAIAAPAAFRWGDVWEWTASPFAPFAGFRPHPYRDYSAPWFDGRPVLRGASFMTQPRMCHPRFRNFFQAHRNDVPAGFRSCAVRADPL